ncbi:HAD-superfamily hydrolase, subfamily IIB [Promicromonospora umidemergens]|uniref:HAD family hydrolase n=2 Tax=Promicromonospora umidemergens TaxID=629679 RepID=A0ABP8X7B9_9MICO|nr:HAD-superfamily hydrolase, subfamily IIB [Promicromonospora umidemergens]
MEPTAPALVACDIDGTLVRTGHPVTLSVRTAAELVRVAGHHIVLATGRSLVGALPVALQLGLDGAWIVASNGAITAHLVDGYYEITEQHIVDAEAAIRIALAEAPPVRIAAEIVGAGYRVSTPFPNHELNGAQHSVRDLSEFWTNPTPRLALRGPSAYQLVPSLRAAGLTAIATRLDWVDVTAPGISKATALEEIRTHLGVEDYNTVAIGDSENDVEMLDWAACGIAMAHAPAFVIAAADRTTGTIDDDGAASALLSLLN